MPPQKFREIVFLLLFSQDAHESDPESLQNAIKQELKVSQKQVLEGWKKYEAIKESLADLDDSITKFATSYDLHRIQKVELAILRLCAYELLFEKELEVAIVIAEAKRLAKKFATPDAAAFCQAILDAMMKETC